MAQEKASVFCVFSGMGKAKTLRMPLDTQNGQLFVIHGFYDEIRRILGDEEIVSKTAKRLMVSAVHDGARSV